MPSSLDNNSKDLESLFLDEIILSNSINTPQKTAILFNEISISYFELSERIENVAQHLLKNGISAGDFVVVLLPPSEAITIALLAIIRIGAIYSPLDPQDPETQLISKCNEINAKCIITNDECISKVSSWNPTVVNIEHLEQSIPTESRILPQRSLNDPACIFFTSGSSGKSKGVLGSARALRDSILHPTEALHLKGDDTLNSIARYAWSISMLELLSPLVVGGTSLILNSRLALDLKWLKKQVLKCTAFHCPPALLRNFTDHIEQANDVTEYLSNIRLVWYGGDNYSSNHIQKLHKVFPQAIVGTAYGCTEIFGLSHIYYYKRTATIKNVLIGKPINGMGQIICNIDNPASSNVHEGEILLSGSRLAIEYWNNPKLNTQKFTDIDGIRYFKTGDYALQDENRNLEFLHRKDNQVKIRGIRIELGEIEYQLSLISEIKEVVVLAVNIDQENKELRAYIIKNTTESTLDTKHLASMLHHKLPDYMIPSKWYELDALPVTENFKIDRKKLSLLEEDDSLTKFTGIEHPLAEIWGQVSGTTPTANEDSFFNLGGNSILTMQLVIEINKRFNSHLEVADIYRNPLLGEQIELIEIEKQTLHSKNNSNINIPTQGQIGLFFRELLSSQHESITCTRYIRTKDGYRESCVRNAINVLLDRYPTLKTNIKVNRGKIELIEHEFTLTDIECIRLEGIWSLAANSTLPLKKHSHKFTLATKPLICSIISTMDDGSEILQLTIHHIAADDNSMSRIAKEFVTIYDALLNKEELEVFETAHDYNQFSLEQFDNISQGKYTKSITLLAEELCNMLSKCHEKPILNLSNWNNNSAAQIESKLPIINNQLSFTDYLAALSWAFFKISKRKEFVFCAHVALRRDSDSESFVGMYVNLMPVITGVNPDHTFHEHAIRTSNDFSKAMSRSDVPFEHVLIANKQLKKLRSYPFDAFVNELDFSETFQKGYENIVVPRAFATDNNEINLTIMKSGKDKKIRLESPSVDNIDLLHLEIINNMNIFIEKLV